MLLIILLIKKADNATSLPSNPSQSSISQNEKGCREGEGERLDTGRERVGRIDARDADQPHWHLLRYAPSTWEKGCLDARLQSRGDLGKATPRQRDTHASQRRWRRFNARRANCPRYLMYLILACAARYTASRLWQEPEHGKGKAGGKKETLKQLVCVHSGARLRLC